MLKIILCDDDPLFLSLENDIISKIIRGDNIDAAVSCTASSASEIIAFTESNPGTYLVFIDLDFGENLPNGIDISSLLKQKETMTRVVFTTNHHEMAMNVLKSGIEPFGFLEKGANTDIFAAGLRRYIHMALRAESKIGAIEAQSQAAHGTSAAEGSDAGADSDEFSTVSLPAAPGETIEIFLSDILYIETQKNISHGITYHTVNGSQITVIGTLDAEAEKLGSCFLRVHRSYIAAKSQIIGIKDGYITLSNQEEIPCSFKMRQEIKKLLSRKLHSHG